MRKVWLKLVLSGFAIAVLFLMVIFVKVWIGEDLNQEKINLDETVNNMRPVDDPSLATADVWAQRQRKTRSLLNGAEVGYDRVRQKVLAVMVENSVEARPFHRGISRADVIYETLVEGGITRFLAIFQGNKVDEIGPVRSVRPYFLDWAAEYDGVVVHAGGSAKALNMLYSGYFSNLRDLDAGYFVDAFWRDHGLLKKVTWEHVLFTSINGLEEVVEKKEWIDWKVPEVWLFANDGEDIYVESEEMNEVEVNFSREAFNVKYKYDEESGKYLRSMLGIKHVDSFYDEQLAPSNLVVLHANIGLMAGNNFLGWVDVQTVGEGEAELFTNGKVVSGKWSRKAEGGRLRLVDDERNEMVFSPGQIWIHVVPN